MAFTDYKNFTILKAKHPQIIINSEDFIPDLLEIEVESYLQRDIHFGKCFWDFIKFCVAFLARGHAPCLFKGIFS